MEKELKAEPKFTLAEFSKEETESLTKDLTEVLAKHQGHLEAIPKIVRNGQQFGIGTDIIALKKIELVPKQEGIKSPYTNGADSPATETA